MAFNNYLLTFLLCLGAVPAASACAFHSVPEVELAGTSPMILSSLQRNIEVLYSAL